MLAKLCFDHWEYLIGTRQGLIFHCTDADCRGGWIHVNGIQKVTLSNGRELSPGDWGRGVDLRVSEVAWVCDCES